MNSSADSKSSVPCATFGRRHSSIIPLPRSPERDLSPKSPHIMRKRTSFSTISVREYDQTLGDSPSCLDGAPVSLDWTYQKEKSICLNKYEDSRHQQRRRRSELVMGAAERRKLLVGNGLSVLDVIRAERMVSLRNNGSRSVEKQLEDMKLQDPTKKTNPGTNPRIASKKRSVVSRAA